MACMEICTEMHAPLILVWICMNLLSLALTVCVCLSGGHSAALLHTGYSLMVRRHSSEYLQAGHTQDQAVRGAGRTSSPTQAHAEVTTQPFLLKKGNV